MKMKRILVTALVLTAAVLMLLALSSCGSKSGLIYEKRDDGYWIIDADLKGSDKEIVIPDSHKGSPVVGIEAEAFADSPFLETVTIPASVISIKHYAFKNCPSLTTLSVATDNPNYRSVGNCIISYYGGLVIGCQGSVIPEQGFESIAEGAFYGCTALNYVRLHDGVTEIDDYAFYGCTGLTDISFPSGLTRIGKSAFQGCKSLSHADLPQSVKWFGDKAFEGCELVVEHVDGIGYIGSWAISSENDVVNAKLRDGTVGITYSAFNQKQNLKTIDIPSSVIYMHSASFLNCVDLESITIPEGNESLPTAAFKGCGSLTSITLPSTLKTLPSNIFEDCTALRSIEIPNGITEIQYGAFLNCMSLNDIKLPDTVEKIGDYAFGKCIALESIVIPDSVTELGGAFYYCWRLKDVKLSENLTVIASETFRECTALKKIKLPRSVTRLCTDAFLFCEGLEAIGLYEGVTTVEACAFDTMGKFKVYCEARSMPSGWDASYSSLNSIIWGCDLDNMEW